MNCVAISKANYPANLEQEITEVGLEMVPIAKEQPGFISIAFHKSNTTGETMIYWELEPESDHENCMISSSL